MPADLPRWRRAAELTGRDAERAGARPAGQSRARRREPGAGGARRSRAWARRRCWSTWAGSAPGCRVVARRGCPVGDGAGVRRAAPAVRADAGSAGALPAPQRDALRTAFGISAGPPPDRFLVGLAVLSLLSEVAEEQPLVCLVDDEQWLDRASAQVSPSSPAGCGAESVGLVFATRVPGGDLAGLPELVVGGPAGGRRAGAAGRGADRADRCAGPRPDRRRDTRQPAGAAGAATGLTPAELAGGFGLPGAVPLAGSIEESFRRRVGALPRETRRLLLVAAADPSGDPALVWRAAARLGIGADAAAPASRGRPGRVRRPGPVPASAGPLGGLPVGVRSGAAAAHRRPGGGHRSAARSRPPCLAPGAGRSRAGRGRRRRARALGRPGAGARRPGRRGRVPRARGDADARPGAPGRTGAGRRAGQGPGGRVRRGAGPAGHGRGRAAQRAPAGHVDLVRAQLAFVTSRGSDAPPLLLKAARRLEPIDAGLSRATYLDALSAGDVRRPPGQPRRRCRGGGPRRQLRRRRRHARAHPISCSTAWPREFTDGYAAGTPMLRRALADFGAGMSAEEELRWLWLATVAAMRCGTTMAGSALRPARPARPRGRRAQRASARAHLTRLHAPVRRRADRRGVADRRGAGGQGGDRQPTSRRTAAWAWPRCAATSRSAAPCSTPPRRT